MDKANLTSITLIGLGQIGALYDKSLATSYSHLNSLIRYKNIPSSSIFIYDLNSQLVNSVADKFSVNPCFTLEEIPIKSELTIISSPTNTHLSMIKNIFEVQAVKCLLLEKPMGSNLNEALQIEEISSSCQTKTYINFMRNFLPSSHQVKKIFEEWLKTDESFTANVIYTGGMINNASHFLALFRYLTNISFEEAVVDSYGEGCLSINFRGSSRLNIEQVNLKSGFFFSMTLLHSCGCLIYDEASYTWSHYEYTDLQSDKNTTGFFPRHMKTYFSELKHAQDHVLSTIVESKYLPTSLQVCPSTCVSIHSLLQENV